MNKRSIKKQFYVNREEAQALRKKAKDACMTEARLIRFLISGYSPPPAPDERFYEAMEIIRKLYGRMEIIERDVNTPEMKKFLQDEITSWKKFRMAMEMRYLLPERTDGKWR